ncbi:MAG: hypothetical protein WHV66_07975, partial [Anaerolineales bacterium]
MRANSGAVAGHGAPVGTGEAVYGSTGRRGGDEAEVVAGAVCRSAVPNEGRSGEVNINVTHTGGGAVAGVIHGSTGVALVGTFSERIGCRAGGNTGERIVTGVGDGRRTGGDVPPAARRAGRADCGGDGRSGEVNINVTHAGGGAVAGVVVNRLAVGLIGTFAKGIVLRAVACKARGIITAGEAHGRRTGGDVPPAARRAGRA